MIKMETISTLKAVKLYSVILYSTKTVEQEQMMMTVRLPFLQ